MKLLPGKHAHPDETLLAAAAVLLGELVKYRVVSYGELKAALVSEARRPRSAEYLFQPAVDLLFLLDLVAYMGASDAFEYRGPV